MQKYIAVLAVIMLIGMVITRALMLNKKGIKVFKFGETDKKDFLIPPFAFFYFYLIFAHAFDFPSIPYQELFSSEIATWFGAALCSLGLALFLWSLISFKTSFRVGIDEEQPDELITTGVFAISRNPIYVSFGLVLIGQFLIFPSWILLTYLLAGIWLFHRQVLREEEFLKNHYGQVHTDYCKQVRRYL